MAKPTPLKQRTYAFAIGVVKLSRLYPRTLEGRVFCEPEVESLRAEADELVAIFTQAHRTARRS